jgi:hypothetical protein
VVWSSLEATYIAMAAKAVAIGVPIRSSTGHAPELQSRGVTLEMLCSMVREKLAQPSVAT